MTIFFKDEQTATIAINTATTGEIDLQQPSDFIQVEFPTLDSCTVKITAARVSGGTFRDLGNGVTTETFTGACMRQLRCAGYQFIKLVTSANQAAERTIIVRGGRY